MLFRSITPNDKILLKLRATEDTRGQNTAVGTTGTVTTNVPAINTQEVESNVLLNNNETIVIGGVYKQTDINSVDRIPFFGSLPFVGVFFSYKQKHNEKHELLIFITPRIIMSNPCKPLHKMVVKVPQRMSLLRGAG